jgi:hypothetical protein
MAYRGRGPNLTIGAIEHIYSKFHSVGGLMLPGRVDVTFNGTPCAELSGEFSEQTVDDPADAAKLELPADDDAPAS